MNCKEYQRRIVDELASNEALSAHEVIGHRAACAGCAQFYDEQAALFSRIDAGMRSLANEEVDATLLPKVRQALLAEPQRSAVPVWGYALVATACALILFLAHTYRRPAEGTLRAERPTAQMSASSAGNTGLAEGAARPRDGVRPANNFLRKAAPAKSRVENEAPAPDLQIVVSEEERRAFVRWVAALPKQHDALEVLTKPVPSKPEQPIEIALMKLDSVDVKGVKTEEPSMK
jgi:hypothetical protein